MPRIIIIAIAALFSVTVYGQDNLIPNKDSILLNKFWKEMRIAVNTRDKAKLATLCAFPYYCRPCLDDTTLKVKEDEITVKVTKELFYKSQYKLFFDKKFKKTIDGPSFFFQEYDQNQKPYGFSSFM